MKNDAETEAAKVWNCLTLQLDINVKPMFLKMLAFWTTGQMCKSKATEVHEERCGDRRLKSVELSNSRARHGRKKRNTSFRSRDAHIVQRV